ncbi:MAG TPA: response regulator transcription factor [Acidimicrobiales bacterium]|nr:response regulator transcription factor [Acidimicrobiales bacterium]
MNAVTDEAVGTRAGAIKVMVVDDHAVFAEALAMAINASGRMRCVAIANDADEAHRLAEENHPDVVVMDVGLDGEGGIAATSSLRKSRPQTRVLVLTGQVPTAPLVHAAAQAGASALLLKSNSLTEVVDTIPSLAEHAFAMDHKTLELLCAPGLAAPNRSASPFLTRREYDILGLLARGVDLQSAAHRLGITVNTARGYVKGLYRKLNVHTQLELLAVARERGLIDSES